MHPHETSLSVLTAILNLQSRTALLMALASVVVKSGSAIETTLEVTNRVVRSLLSCPVMPGDIKFSIRMNLSNVPPSAAFQSLWSAIETLIASAPAKRGARFLAGVRV